MYQEWWRFKNRCVISGGLYPSSILKPSFFISCVRNKHIGWEQCSLTPLEVCTVYSVPVNIISSFKFNDTTKLPSYLIIPYKIYINIVPKVFLNLDTETKAVASVSENEVLDSKCDGVGRVD